VIRWRNLTAKNAKNAKDAKNAKNTQTRARLFFFSLAFFAPLAFLAVKRLNPNLTLSKDPR
jgi:uncharacterized membrane protein YhaH (DUF805 family)